MLEEVSQAKPKKTKKKPPPIKPGTLLARPRKGSRDEIFDRRQSVMRLRMRGLGYRAIGKTLGIGYMTVVKDLALMKEELQNKVGKLEKDYAIAQSISVYEEIEMQAWDQFEKCPDGTQQKSHFLNVVRAARNDQVKLLTDIGLIAKAPQEVRHMVTSKVIADWTPAAQDLIALAIVKAKLTPAGDPEPENQLPAHIPSCIDIREEEIEEEAIQQHP